MFNKKLTKTKSYVTNMVDIQCLLKQLDNGGATYVALPIF